ncbi:hypothetical protein ACFSSF_00635 [Dietzia aerolata]|uniref:hypothetical protein n=1 Tax=Dietzia aerolata TaxID=595984 RepID=UPI00363B6349
MPLERPEPPKSPKSPKSPEPPETWKAPESQPGSGAARVDGLDQRREEGDRGGGSAVVDHVHRGVDAGVREAAGGDVHRLGQGLGGAGVGAAGQGHRHGQARGHAARDLDVVGADRTNGVDDDDNAIRPITRRGVQEYADRRCRAVDTGRAGRGA